MAEEERVRVYRILHKPTGLYYQSVKGRFQDTRTNLGPNGKVYISGRPKFKDLSHGIHISEKQAINNNIQINQFGMIKLNEDDFKILEFKLVEVPPK